MSGYSTRAFDLDRLLHYSAFTPQGADDPRARPLGLGAIHLGAGRIVSRDLFPPHGPGDRPGTARAVSRQQAASVSRQSAGTSRRVPAADRMVAADGGCALAEERPSRSCASLGVRWQQFLRRKLRWKMACEQTVFFAPGEAEQGSVLSNAAAFEAAVRRELPRGAARPAAEGRYGPARPSPRRPHPGGRPELPLRSGHGQDPQPRRPRVVPPHCHQLSHLPHLRPGQPPQRRTGRRPGPPDRRRGDGRRDEYVTESSMAHSAYRSGRHTERACYTCVPIASSAIDNRKRHAVKSRYLTIMLALSHSLIHCSREGPFDMPRTRHSVPPYFSQIAQS